MPRYAAFLRGVSPMNAKMPELKQCFEKAGFTHVKTVLSSGNVAFEARAGSEESLERRIEAAMKRHLDRVFQTIVRPVDHLVKMIESDPFQDFRLKPGSKRVVTFLRERPSPLPKLPLRKGEAAILAVKGREAFSAYVSGPEGPVFMTLIERTFGKEVTTRTWDTLRKMTR